MRLMMVSFNAFLLLLLIFYPFIFFAGVIAVREEEV
jgi:outer membrane lipoprotein-sorting protein